MQEEAWFGLYRLFKAIGMPRVTVPVEIKKGSYTYSLPMGWPELKIAVTLDSGEGKKFTREGWQLVHIPANALNAAEPIIAMLDELVRKRTVAASFAEAQLTVSKTENKLLDAILAAGISEPDRNYKFVDQYQDVVTVPDFVWENEKVAVFVDGEFFHGIKDLGDALQIAFDNDPDIKTEILSQAKDTMSRDATKRRKLVKAGWKVVVVTASEIDTGNLTGIVGDIKAALQQPVYAEEKEKGHKSEEHVWTLPDTIDPEGNEEEQPPSGVTSEQPPTPQGQPKSFLPPPNEISINENNFSVPKGEPKNFPPPNSMPAGSPKNLPPPT